MSSTPWIRASDVLRLVHHQAVIVETDETHRFDEVVVPVVVAGQAGVDGVARIPRAELQPVAGLRLKVRIRDGGVTELHIGESDVDVVVRRRAEAARIAAEQRPVRSELPHHAQLRRHTGLADVGQYHARIVAGEDRILLGIEAVVVDAQAGHQAERAVSEADLVLHVECGGGGLADGEVAHRKDVRQHHRRADAGQRERPQAIALLPRLGARQIDAVCQLVAYAITEGLADIGLQSVCALVEIELALADVAQRRRRQHALFARVLRGFAVLPVDLPVQAVGEGGFEPVPCVRERQARTRLVIARRDRSVGGPRQRLQAALGQQVGVGRVLVAFDGQGELLVLVRREHQLAQQAAAVALLRIGLRARTADAAHTPLVLGFLALAVADIDQPAPALTTEGGGCAAEQPAPTTVVAETDAEIGVLAVMQIVGRILRDERHNATECVRAVQ